MPRHRVNPDQAELPLVQAGGGGADRHAVDCRCPQCQGWVEDAALRRAAERTLARRRERQRAKALSVTLALAEQERQTDAYLDRQAQAVERARRDPRLEALLRSRKAGKPVNEALAEVERRFGLGH